MALRDLFTTRTVWRMKSYYGASNVTYHHAVEYNCNLLRLDAPDEIQAAYSDTETYFKILCPPTQTRAYFIVGVTKPDFTYSEIYTGDGAIDGSAGYYTTQPFFGGLELRPVLMNNTTGALCLDEVGGESASPTFHLGFETAGKLPVTGISADTTISDGEIHLTWETPKQNAFAVRVTDPRGAVVFETESGVQKSFAAKGCTIPARALANGLYTVSVQTACLLMSPIRDENGKYAGIVSDWTAQQMAFSRLRAEVLAFEPDGVAQNREREIAVYWTSARQHGYVLRVLQGGVAVRTYTGARETAVTLPAFALASGETALELTLKYIPDWGGEADAVFTAKTISFRAYGTPAQPVMTSPALFSSAFPVFTWTADEQFSYRLTVTQGGAPIFDSGVVQSADRQHVLREPLDNGAYVVTVQVISEFDLASPVAAQGFTIRFEKPEPPRLFAGADTEAGAVRLTLINPPGGVPVSSCDILRRERGTADWVRIAAGVAVNSSITDHTPASGVVYAYRARAIGQAWQVSDGAPVEACTTVHFTRIAPAADPANAVVLQLEPNKSEAFRRGVYFMDYSGLPAPKVEFGGAHARKLSASFLLPEADARRLIDLFYSAPLLLYRDNRGRKLYGMFEDEPTLADSAPGYAAVSFQFIECSHSEAV